VTRFYQDLLGTREGLKNPMPKAEALSKAKKWLRSLNAKEVTERLNELPRGIPREKPAAPPSASPRPYQHPYYWAAFILIGDPD